jgi:hypothetical protein
LRALDRSGQEETQTPILNEPVDLVQQLRDHLDLIDDDHPPVILVALAEQSRPCSVLAEDVGLEQIAHVLRIGLPQPERFPGLPRSTEEGRSLGRQLDDQRSF